MNYGMGNLGGIVKRGGFVSRVSIPIMSQIKPISAAPVTTVKTSVPAPTTITAISPSVPAAPVTTVVSNPEAPSAVVPALASPMLTVSPQAPSVSGETPLKKYAPAIIGGAGILALLLILRR